MGPARDAPPPAGCAASLPPPAFLPDPLLQALKAPSPSLPLHLPAHGRGRGLAPALRSLLRRPAASWDLPELPEIGGPLEADGAVAAAQARAAALCGADHCWFGVNGASGLLQAAVLALAPPGSRLLLPRNLHRSLLHGCVLAQVEPLLYSLPFEACSGLWLPPDAAHLERVLQQALASGPVAALVLVDPTYQGLQADLTPLIAFAHRQGLPVLVDQAHGRGDAVAAGADLTVLSLQKAAGGLAQSAVLLSRGTRLSLEALERSLLWLQTSSPSALLLASCSAAITALHSRRGQRQRARAEACGLRLQQRCRELDLPLLEGGDPLRPSLLTAPLGFTGLDADAWLLARGVVAELPEPGCLCFCLGERPPWGVEKRLPRQLLQLRRALGGDPLPPFSPPPLPLLAAPDLPLGVAWRAPRRRLPLAETLNRWAAEPLCPYPPGIPLLVPGERIEAARLDWLLQMQRLWPDQIPAEISVVDRPGP
ncbi:MAG: lysine decarboxylase [Cyanobium sp.]